MHIFETRLHFRVQMGGKTISISLEKWAISWVNAKLKNNNFCLYLRYFREVGHPGKSMFFTNFLYSASDPLAGGVLETTFTDFYHFGLHLGTPISSLLAIIFQTSKIWNDRIVPAILAAIPSGLGRLGGNHHRFSPLALATTGPAIGGKRHLGYKLVFSEKTS